MVIAGGEDAGELLAHHKNRFKTPLVGQRDAVDVMPFHEFMNCLDIRQRVDLSVPRYRVDQVDYDFECASHVICYQGELPFLCSTYRESSTETDRMHRGLATSMADPL